MCNVIFAITVEGRRMALFIESFRNLLSFHWCGISLLEHICPQKRPKMRKNIYTPIRIWTHNCKAIMTDNFVRWLVVLFFVPVMFWDKSRLVQRLAPLLLPSFIDCWNLISCLVFTRRRIMLVTRVLGTSYNCHLSTIIRTTYLVSDRRIMWHQFLIPPYINLKQGGSVPDILSFLYCYNAIERKSCLFIKFHSVVIWTGLWLRHFACLNIGKFDGMVVIFPVFTLVLV